MSLKSTALLIIFFLVFQQAAVAVSAISFSEKLDASTKENSVNCHGHEDHAESSSSEEHHELTKNSSECCELGCFCCIGGCHPTLGGQAHQMPERKIELAADRYSFILPNTSSNSLFRPPRAI